jgi:2-octaprenyl-6-methoxyphenol hydroxylase
MAEAAHVVPPIGAQGLNMSLADLACLLDLLAKTGTATIPEAPRSPTPTTAAATGGAGPRHRDRPAEPRLDGRGAAPARPACQGAGRAVFGAPVRQILMRAGLGMGRISRYARPTLKFQCIFAQICRSAPRQREPLKHVSGRRDTIP